MKITYFQSLTNHKYTQLLLTLLLLFLAYAVVGAVAAEVILSFILLTAIVLIVRTFFLQQRAFYFYIVIAGLAFVSDCIYILFTQSSYHRLIPALIADSVYIGFLVFSIVLMLHKLFENNKVTIDTIVGGICIFLLIGDLWFLFYSSIHLFQPDAFNSARETIQTFDLLYFSFTTLTTVGYGDVTPVSQLAKVVANFEAIIGVIYPAIFISRLVGGYHPK